MSDTSTEPKPLSKGFASTIAAIRDVLDSIKLIISGILLLLLLLVEIFNAYTNVCRFNAAIGNQLKTVQAGFGNELSVLISQYFEHCSAIAANPEGLIVLAGGRPEPLLAAVVPAVPADAGKAATPQGRDPASIPSVVPTEPATSPTAPSEATTIPASDRSGWVALGFLPDHPGGADDGLFTLPKGRTLATLSKDDVVTATTSVNLRKGAADWTRPRAVIGAGRKAKILETPKALPAGKLSQVWAHVVFE